jgi:hypothetical protein
MATNPRIPPENREPLRGGRPELVPGRPKPVSAAPGVWVAIIVAAVLLAAIIYYLPRAPKKTPPPTAGEIPVQPANNQLQFSNLKLAVAPTGGAMSLDGQLMNTGDRAVLGATVELTFRDAGGKAIETVDRPIEGVAQKNGALVTDEFGTDPIKANQPRLFRVTVDRVPAGWDHKMPEMKVMTVAEEGSR